MALSISPSFVNQINSIMVLAQDSNPGIAVRVASLASGTLGVLVASGAASVNWSVVGAPSWVVPTISVDTLTCTLLFNSAEPQADPYQFYVVCTIGTQSIYFPVLLEVREPFFIAEQSGLTVLNIQSFDSTVADIVINGYGLNDTVLTSGVRFIQPVLPAGLSLITQSENGARLRVDQPTTGNLAGGMQQPGVSQLTLQAYRPGSFYDTPDRAYQANFTIQSLTTKAGHLDFALAAFYDTSNNWIRVDSLVDFLQGQGKTFTYNWSYAVGINPTSPPTGPAVVSLAAGGGSANFVAYTVSSAGTLTVFLTVKDSGGNTIAIQSTGPIDVAPTGSWAATDAIKVNVTDDEHLGYSDDTVSYTVTCDVQSGEAVTLDFVIAPGGSTESVISPPSPITLTYPTNSAVVSFNLPASTELHEKWMLQISATNEVASPFSPATRTGFAQVMAESSGDPIMTVTSPAGGNTLLSSNTGSSIAPVLLSTNVGSPTFRLAGAPDGLLIQNGYLVGNTLKPGSYTFKVSADATSYQRSFSSVVTLNVASLALPLSVTDPTVNFVQIADNTPFNVSWGYAGTPAFMTMQQNFTVRDVTGVTQASTSEVGSSVISIYGESFYGTAYSVPLFILSTSAAALAQLQSAPTIGSIDENYFLTLNWQPILYNNDPTYAIYRAWDIYLNLNGGGPQLQSLSTGLPTGLEPAGSSLTNRLFEEQLVAGDYTISMTALSNNQTAALNSNPWDSFRAFPTALLATQVTLSLQTAQLGQSVTITLDPAYSGADQWRVLYSDNTTSGWLPLSIKSVAKSFNTSGNMTIVVETERDYLSANPPVRLRRQVTKSVFVSNVQFQTPGASSSSVTDNVGFGGESGFEITNTTSGAVAPQPYEVLVRSIVKDVVTSELKLMVAASRYTNASSLLGTLALDVFPLPGRPHDLELINLDEYLLVQSNTSSVPVKISTQQSNVPQIIVGKPMAEFHFNAQGGTIPYTWYSDNLPFGLKLSTDGTLSGTIMRLGSFAVDFAVSDQSAPAFIDESTLNIVSVSDLAITTTSLSPVPQVGTPYSFTMLNTGGLPPFQWAIVGGALPIGLSIDPGTGIISGVPSTYNSTTDFNKTYSATIQVTDSVGAKISILVSTSLLPAALTLGANDQPIIFASEDFKFAVPVYGGRSPYTLSSFAELPSDIVIGNGLAVVNPTVVDVVAGIAPPTLVITTSTLQFFPQAYPVNIEFPLAATGGVSPYTFYVDPSGNTTLPGATIYGEIMVASPIADGVFQVAVKCVDAVGHVASATVSVLVQQENVGVYTMKPVSVNFNGNQTNPGVNGANWIITPLANLPDAQNGSSYAPAPGEYYGLALYQSGTLHLTQNAGFVGQMSPAVRSGALPGGMTFSLGSAVVGSGDWSGIILFNFSGGSSPIVNGPFSFEFEWSNVQPVSGTATQTVARESITVTPSGIGTTAVVVIVTTDELDLNLNTVSGSPYAWFYPLEAEGGSGSYTFSILSGTTLPGATLAPLGNGTAIVSTTTQVGNYVVRVQATDSNNVPSLPVTIAINLVQGVTQPIHILSSNLPASFYAGRAIPANTYYVEADLIANWSATNLPAGVSITTAPNQRVYLSGTPTATGISSIQFTATSTIYGTKASQTYPLQIKPRTATITTSPTMAVINKPYRVISNNSILTVTYVGYQPTDADLPTLTALLGIVGSPFVPGTTGNLNLTADGFQMQYDYQSATAGAETISLVDTSSPPNVLDHKSFTDVYPLLQAVGQNVSASVSEYATASPATFNPPVSIVGGNAPYTVNLIGFSDSRFFAQSGQVAINVNQFAPGGTYPCIVSMTITDNSSPQQSVTITGTLSVTVQIQTTDTVLFSNGTWSLSVTSGPQSVVTFDPNSLSLVQLAHLPVQYYVNSVTIPSALQAATLSSSFDFVTVSPSKRRLAIKFGGVDTSVADLDTSLNPSSGFLARHNDGSTPATGQYTIVAHLRVVDAKGITTQQDVNIVLTLN